MEIDTPHGLARAHVRGVQAPHGTLVLGHGAGGSVSAPDLQAAVGAVAQAGFEVVLVEQPYRVAGRRSAAPAHQLDAAWSAVLAALAPIGPLVVGGRSSGARVACRTAAATGAAGVLCLAFPVVTPRGASRLEELDAVAVPTLVVQGASDRFGMPPAGPRRAVVEVRGDHGLKADLPAVTTAVREWLDALAQANAAGSGRASASRNRSR